MEKSPVHCSGCHHIAVVEPAESVDELQSNKLDKKKIFYVTGMRTHFWHLGSKPHHAIWETFTCEKHCVQIHAYVGCLAGPEEFLLQPL